MDTPRKVQSPQSGPHRSARFACALAVCQVLVLSGCTSGPTPVVTENVTPVRQHREDDVVASFERRRDTAQLQAAMAQWRSGNIAAARELLETLVARNPEHQEAWYQLANICLEMADDQAGSACLEQLLTRWPDDARAHHTKGLLLDSGGDSSAADFHFRRALEIEPENPLFRLTVRVDNPQDES